MKHLNANGKGKFSYDYANDILYFGVKGEEYKDSIEFNEFVIDCNKEDLVIGLRILDASKKLKIPKYCLNALKGFSLDTTVSGKEIHIQLTIRYEQRNKKVQSAPVNFLRDSPYLLGDSQAKASA